MPKKYRRSPIRTLDPSVIEATQYDVLVNGQRNSEVGHVIDIILGALNVAVKVGEGCQIRIWNNDTAAHFVKFGDSTVTAPTTPADGIPVPPKDYVLLGMGENTHIIADSAQVFGYRIAPNSTLTVTTEL